MTRPIYILKKKKKKKKADQTSPTQMKVRKAHPGPIIAAGLRVYL